MPDQTVSASSHAEWLKSILADHRAMVGISPAFIMVCTANGPLRIGQLVRAAGSAIQIEEGDHVEPCDEATMPHGISTTDIEDGAQTITIIVGL